MATYYYTSLFKKSDVRITNGYSTSHRALDLSRGVVRTPIYSPNKLGTGTVSRVDTSYVSSGKTWTNSLVVWVAYDNGLTMKLYHGQVGDKVVNKGDRVRPGQQIYRTGNTGNSSGDHLHVAIAKTSSVGSNIDPTPWVINDNIPVPNFKIGQRIVFTGVQYIRKGAGDKFSIQRSTVLGEEATIIDGPRTSQNKQFNLGENDSYTWWDVKTSGSGTGWVADVNKFKIQTEPTPEQPPTTSPSTPNCDEYIKQVELLQKEIEALKETNRTLTELADGYLDKIDVLQQLLNSEELNSKEKLLRERVEFLESTLMDREGELKELITKYQTSVDYSKHIEVQFNEVVKELNELKQGRDTWINRLADMLHKLFNK